MTDAGLRLPDRESESAPEREKEGARRARGGSQRGKKEREREI